MVVNMVCHLVHQIVFYAIFCKRHRTQYRNIVFTKKKIYSKLYYFHINLFPRIHRHFHNDMHEIFLTSIYNRNLFKIKINHIFIKEFSAKKNYAYSFKFQSKLKM